MRSLFLFTAITSVAFITSVSGANAQLRGMHKHDASIANHSYNIPIIEDTESGSGNLKQDMDQGKVSPSRSAAPANLGIQSRSGAVIGAPAGAQAMPAQNNAAVSPIAVGTQAPDFALASFAGGNVALKDLIARGPVLVVFTPGTTASNGLKPLQLIQKNLRQFETLGVSVVAITPEPLNIIQMNQGQNNFAFHILNDSNNDIARQYGVLQGYEPAPSLFSIDAAGKIAAVQVQQQLNGAFDLKLATDPLRGQTQAAIPAPVAAATQLPVALPADAPIGQVSPDPDMADPLLDAPVAPGSQMKPVMPAVPSPQTNKDVPPSNVPKVSYEVPPSNPDYKKPAAKRDLTI